MPTANTVPFDLLGFQIDQVDESDELLTILAHSTAKAAKCPTCRATSTSIHSHYQRSPRDGPCCGREVRLVLTVHRFRCPTPYCEQTIFVERIPQIVPVHGQRTQRLTLALQALVHELSAEVASRWHDRLG